MLRYLPRTSEQNTELQTQRWSWPKSVGASVIAAYISCCGVPVPQADLSPVSRRHGVAVERERLSLPSALNQVWSMDFVFDALSTGLRVKCLTVVDDFIKEAVGIVMEHGISGVRVTRALDEMARFRGNPDAIRTGQGPEFTDKALD